MHHWNDGRSQVAPKEKKIELAPLRECPGGVERMVGLTRTNRSMSAEVMRNLPYTVPVLRMAPNPIPNNAVIIKSCQRPISQADTN